MLELALTPYDVLRLRLATALNSQELLDTYILIEQEPGEPFPRLYLTMVDDGKASCVFVSEKGCTVYPHRPAACRTYPLGRAAKRTPDGDVDEFFVLLQEPHCRGFGEAAIQDVTKYCKDQELHPYNASNDTFMRILQHDAIRQGFMPTKKQIELFILALFNLDTFREQLQQAMLAGNIPAEYMARLMENDEELLEYGIELVIRELSRPCSPSTPTDILGKQPPC